MENTDGYYKAIDVKHHTCTRCEQEFREQPFYFAYQTKMQGIEKLCYCHSCMRWALHTLLVANTANFQVLRSREPANEKS